MSNEPSWKNCKDCCKATISYPSEEYERISRNNQISCGSQNRELQGTMNLATLCDKCIKITPCSICKKIVLTQEGEEDKEVDESMGHKNILEISNYNEEPICSDCKNIQCYRCGEEGDIKTWYGWIMCEECGMSLCNNCDGECNNPCPNCERPCDNDCDCSEEKEDDEGEDNVSVHESSKEISTKNMEVSLANKQTGKEYI